MQIVVTLPDEDVRVLLEEVQYRVSPQGKGYYEAADRTLDGIIQQALKQKMPRFRQHAAVLQWAARKNRAA
jgi:hypothetical protein